VYSSSVCDHEVAKLECDIERVFCDYQVTLLFMPTHCKGCSLFCLVSYADQLLVHLVISTCFPLWAHQTSIFTSWSGTSHERWFSLQQYLFIILCVHFSIQIKRKRKMSACDQADHYELTEDTSYRTGWGTWMWNVHNYVFVRL
jgi:hypothetical protein